MKLKSALLLFLIFTSHMTPSVLARQRPLAEKIGVAGGLALATLGGGFLSYKFYESWQKQLQDFDTFRYLLEKMGVIVTSSTEVDCYGDFTMYTHHLSVVPTKKYTRSEITILDTYVEKLKYAWYEKRAMGAAFYLGVGVTTFLAMFAVIAGHDVMAEVL